VAISKKNQNRVTLTKTSPLFCGFYVPIKGLKQGCMVKQNQATTDTKLKHTQTAAAVYGTFLCAFATQTDKYCNLILGKTR